VGKLFHLGNYGELTAKLKPQSIAHIAMVLALIRPGKKHLQSLCIERGFDSIKAAIWQQDSEEGYVFKHSHAISYSMLVYVHANLLLEQAAAVSP
jgi:DNA polymerase III alpha subunit